MLICLALGLPATQARAFQAQEAGPVLPADTQAPRLIPRTPAEREQRYLAQHRIILNVRVADASGKPYRELGQGDFTVFDNDRARSLVSFRSVDGSAAQAHVIVVLDAVNNSTRQIHFLEKELGRYLSSSAGPLPLAMSIGVFADGHIGFTPSLRDREALLTELKGRTANLRATGCIRLPEEDAKPDMSGMIKGTAMRGTSAATLACLNERFVASISALGFLARDQVDTPGRAIVIWLGPGWPLLTNKEFAPDGPQLKQNFFDQLVEVSTWLREGQVTLEAIASPDQTTGPGTTSVRDPDFFAGIANADEVRAGNLGLHALAHQTGGHILTDDRDVAGQLGQCIADAEAYYVLAFDSPAAAGFGVYHALGIKVDKPGLDVRTNTLYYGEQ